ncbi:hypothetical protein VTO42DRAFT_4358 [Malbranchea cinnamomea]
MLSLRAFTRSLPRSLSRSVATSAVRPLRPTATALNKPAFNLLSRPAYAAFSTSKPRFESPGQADVELAAKFQEELSLELESGETDKMPKEVRAFLDNGPFEIHDTPGEEEVVLTRKYGDEKIRVTFTIADIHNLAADEDFDTAMGDEFDEGSASQNNPHQSSSSEPGFEDEAREPSYPVRVNVTIEKAGKGAMHVETIAQDGLIQVENVSYFDKPELAKANTAEKEWVRQSLYAGPPFANLDEELQILLERYLDERGIDAALASFVPDYIDFKEQREYVRWLGNLKNFVEN